MDSIFTTVTPTVTSGTDFGLAMVRTLFENIWHGGLVLGLCLLISVLKPPAILVLTLILPFVSALLLLMAAG